MGITYSKWYVVKKLKAKTLKECDPGCCRSLEKDELVGGTDCTFPRKESPALRVINIAE